MAGEFARAGQRAEVVGDVLEGQPAGCVLGVYGHLADGVDRELAVGWLALRDGGEQVYWLADVAQRPAAAGLVGDASELGCERSGVCRA